MDMKANTSNNTVYADSKGISLTGMEILYLSETNINWSKVVDGTTSTTEWKAYMKFRKQFIPTILQMAGYKIAIRHLSLQQGIKVKKENYLLIWHLTEKFQSNKCGSSSQQGRKLYSG
jgi:hypothetical protein